MNDDLNRNTRTLIVSFVLAIMVLIPLRFVEVGNSLSVVNEAVLGETISTSEASEAEARLEPPYDEIDSTLNCIANKDVDEAIIILADSIKNKENESQIEEVVKEIEALDAVRCK